MQLDLSSESVLGYYSANICNRDRSISLVIKLNFKMAAAATLDCRNKNLKVKLIPGRHF